ncbi:MAG: PilZ domain-containing protein [Phycisphaerae bacterium]|nr:PilZ domain-containing protein [Phycisphaerae bacterium]
MDAHQIELVISEAITNRPSVTSASLNLYVYNSKLICGARVVMPKNARFISHISPEIIQQGFSESQWKVIVEKVLWVLKDNASENNSNGDFEERRREERLKIRGSVWFNPEGDKKTLQGQMVDVSSGGMAFTCYNKPDTPSPGQQITTKFSVPWFLPDGEIGRRKFTRTGKICRANNATSYLKRIAVQFAEPLPFKPAEQSQMADTDVEVYSVPEN